ncbi:aminotransferase class I/II-fold pyridoxal phosphate-dependent enzyme [Dysgonomonas sp. Marseille-P4361]|uniref:aminotransferase class I/II-fold pyridoxal phosphate-dependent enzyme n=1 Tax=Dysgonomonas sp. Marseille-P4361 TaxID=2161820 RepID=UPI000D54EE35|nr:aminotransferase class I/II-fold pyridoxal phosphate-dependent enzyme [Dysgonomonas sp. Marseille-P4361]
MINGHGDDIYSQTTKIVSNFSSNMYGLQNMKALDEHLRANIQLIHSYPEPDASSLVKLLAEENSVSHENVLVTNGATEAIYLIAQIFSGSKSAVIYPTFSEYADACMVNKHAVLWASSLSKVSSEADLVWMCNPNNPTGTVTDKSEITKYIETHPEQLLIIDQSYEFFTTKSLFRSEEVIKYKNVVLLHSMTKHYVIPGLRLGYITAHDEIISRVKEYCMPWSVNALALEAGKFLLQNKIKVVDISLYLEETQRLREELSLIDGLSVLQTDTHFFLCKLNEGKASELKRYLIDNYGILIRDAANFYGLDESYFRIAAQSVKENNTLINAVKKWMEQK